MIINNIYYFLILILLFTFAKTAFTRSLLLTKNTKTSHRVLPASDLAQDPLFEKLKSQVNCVISSMIHFHRPPVQPLPPAPVRAHQRAAGVSPKRVRAAVPENAEENR